MTDLVHGAVAAAAIVTRLAREAGSDPRRSALVLALASDVAYGIRGGRREAATEAIRYAEAAGPVADASLHRALLNLMEAKVNAGDGLDHDLLRPGRATGSPPAPGPAARLRGPVPRALVPVHRGSGHGPDGAAPEHRPGPGRRGRLRAGHVPGLPGGHRGTGRRLPGGAGHAGRGRRRGRLARLAAAALDHRAAVRPAHRGRGLGRRAGPGRAEPAGHGPTSRPRPGSWATWSAAGSARGGPTPRARSAGSSGRRRAPTNATSPTRGYGRGWTPGWPRRTWPRAARPMRCASRPGSGRSATGCAAQCSPATRGASTPRPAAQAGDLDVAAESAQRAVAAHESAPLRPELARSLLVLGQVERRRRARRRSRGALGRAHDLAREMGHQPLLALIERELPRVAAARSGPELTVTEQRVAELIAAGVTDRDGPRACSSACGPWRHTSRRSTASSACAAAPSWPAGSLRHRSGSGLRSPTDTAPPGPPSGPRISVIAADFPRAARP